MKAIKPGHHASRTTRDFNPEGKDRRWRAILASVVTLKRSRGCLLRTTPSLDRTLVHVQWDELYVRILDPKSGHLLREHVRSTKLAGVVAYFEA